MADAAAGLVARPVPWIEERDGEAVWMCDGKVWGSWVGKPPTAGI